MLLQIILISMGFLGGTFFTTFLILSIKHRDDLLVRDLLDRLICHSPGDYLNLVYQREYLGIQKAVPWYKDFSFKPLQKKMPPEVPSVGQLEMDRAKKKAAESAQHQKTEDELFEEQQKIRADQRRDTVIP